MKTKIKKRKKSHKRVMEINTGEDWRDEGRTCRGATLLTGIASSPIDIDYESETPGSHSPSRKIRRKRPGRWTSVTLVMIECHMKLEYTHPAAELWNFDVDTLS